MQRSRFGSDRNEGCSEQRHWGELSNVTDSEAETLLELLPLAKSKTVELGDFLGTLSKRSADATLELHIGIVQQLTSDGAEKLAVLLPVIKGEKVTLRCSGETLTKRGAERITRTLQGMEAPSNFDVGELT